MNSRMIVDRSIFSIAAWSPMVVALSSSRRRMSPATPRRNRVWIIGTGEATKYSENGGDLTVSAAAQSGPPAFAEAG